MSFGRPFPTHHKLFLYDQSELVLASRAGFAYRSVRAIPQPGRHVTTSRIAARVRRIKPSPSTSAADRANELRRQGKSIVNLVVGEPDFDTPAHIRKAAAEAMDKGATRDTLMAATAERRQAIVDNSEPEQGLSYAPNEIMA